MEFRLLGEVEAWAEDRQLDLGPPQQRLVLAVLALQVNRLVTVDRLVDLTWPESPPPTARHAIHVRVSRLRAILAMAGAHHHGVSIVTRGPGYILRADPASVDAHRFRALVAAARTEAHNPDLQASLLRRALNLWRGPPLADVATPRVDELCRALKETRLTALEEWLDAELRLGRHEEVIDELADLVVAHPHRQRLLAHLMLALYRAGRAPEALAAYQLARRRLIDEFGLEPGSELQRLQRAILRGDPALELPPERTDETPS